MANGVDINPINLLYSSDNNADTFSIKARNNNADTFSIKVRNESKKSLKLVVAWMDVSVYLFREIYNLVSEYYRY